jgi:hypothetical protein
MIAKPADIVKDKKMFDLQVEEGDCKNAIS